MYRIKKRNAQVGVREKMSSLGVKFIQIGQHVYAERLPTSTLFVLLQHNLVELKRGNCDGIVKKYISMRASCHCFYNKIH